MVQSAAVDKLEIAPPRQKLTGNQIRGFWAAWGGWALDGMDSFIYALVMVPALHELLPRSGIADTPGNQGFYGGLLFALFLVGWGLAMLSAPLCLPLPGIPYLHSSAQLPITSGNWALFAYWRASGSAESGPWEALLLPKNGPRVAAPWVLA